MGVPAMFIRRTVLQALVLLCTSLLCATTAFAQSATVNTDQLTVLPGLSKTAAPIATLSRGDAVQVELTISSVEGEWCYIRADKPVATAGYVPCSSLNRPEPVAAPPLRTPATSARGALTDTAMENMDCEAINYRGWIARYDFTYEQRRLAEKVASDIGLSECTRMAEPFKRQYAADKSAANKRRLLRQWAKTDPSNACETAARKFWPKVRPTMTDTQLARMKEDMVVLRKNVVLVLLDPSKCIPVFCIY